MGSKKIFFVVLAVFRIGAASGLAQTESPQFVETVHMTVKSGAAPQFEEVMKKLVEGSNEVGAPQYWATYQGRIGSSSNEYLVAVPFAKWGEMDQWSEVPDILIKAFGEEEATKILKSLAVVLKDSETRVYRRGPEWSNDSSRSTPAKYAQMGEVQIKPSMRRDFVVLLGKSKEAREKANAPSRTVWQTEQGPVMNFVFATGFDSFSERDRWPDTFDLWVKAHGEQETRQAFETYYQSIEWRKNYVLMFRPELSRSRAAPTTDN